MNGERTQGPSEPQDGAAYFGAEVRYAREHAGLTQQQLADETHYQRPYVTKVETGRLLASEEFADACDHVFGTPGYFGRLRRRIIQQGHPGWFVPYLKLEALATQLLDYSNALVMGMLQTPEYATAVFKATRPRESAEEIKRRVELRIRRHDVLDGATPPLLWVILHESCLRTVVGNREVMRDQMARLLLEAESPHVTIQILPFKAGAPASSLPFTLIAQDDQPTVLYGETRGLGHVNDSATAVAEASITYDRLRAAALSPDDSASMIREVMEGYTS
ncbi:helix-turn-helix domain-containing protein [Streptomyces afghaniensis]|uniref:helix-turn-helix domain-containing protein n=1 Tax=Streptomyces afghaniensis TaxID=66865 RepID=UPI0027846C7F|nr:helix-turn-helix transcriptional regulator [Streptomyces afghaniensis]MDQ1016729.1 transcriptional regulator with XRE-family HTH domain [Streptomyces afghaniensis]